MLLLLLLAAASCADATGSANAVEVPELIDLFHQLGPPLPFPFNTSGDYRIPGLVTSTNGTLLAFIMGRMHRHDSSPTIVYLRRSVDHGATWEPPMAILSDPTNSTEFGGEAVVDPSTGSVHFIHHARNSLDCGCKLRVTSSNDHGATWTAPLPIHVNGSPNSTWGASLASGIALTKGPYAGRLLLAQRSDCCGRPRGSFVIYSDDHGASWSGGQPMVLLPQDGGGWTECQVAQLHNGSVLMTSRNYFDLSSGQGPRLFARSDDGGATWAANWSAYDLPDPYCEGSLLAEPDGEVLYFANPSNANARYNMSIHASYDSGRTWPKSFIVYPGGSEYSDMTLIQNGSSRGLGVFFEKDDANTVAFGVVPLPLL